MNLAGCTSCSDCPDNEICMEGKCRQITCPLDKLRSQRGLHCDRLEDLGKLGNFKGNFGFLQLNIFNNLGSRCSYKLEPHQVVKTLDSNRSLHASHTIFAKCIAKEFIDSEGKCPSKAEYTPMLEGGSIETGCVVGMEHEDCDYDHEKCRFVIAKLVCL